ncbi:glycosyltransferase [Thalassococcus sp. BH17M4-6]|uniref:glycosyltransferase n=1 Tax=Thalassococcus sp. BH17M4-6 TaxID=3413148 RepID=UPI003BD0D079
MPTPGAGISLDTTTDNPPARLLDLTRLVRRAGRRMTGVDRVEFAYLDHLLTDPVPLFGLVRTSLGYALLDAAGCAALHERVRTDGWGAVGWLSRGLARRDEMRARAESDVRRLARARCLTPGLARMLRRVPAGASYLNTGHSNLTVRLLAALKARKARIAVLIHDTIPLDTPQFQRPETLAKFDAFLQRAGRQADLIICNSAQTQKDVIRHLAGPPPDTLVAHLGVPVPTPGPVPQGAWTNRPYFVALGTVEPRKNHTLLLDLWDDLTAEQGGEAPRLLICGARGWENDAVLARLDRGVRHVHELPGLDDGAVFGLLAGSAGLLFPSLAEGYGLPPIEAAALGVPVLCHDLPIYREVLADIPVYADVNDRYLWKITINELVQRQTTGRDHKNVFAPPTWTAHFKTVLTLV